VLAWRPAVRVVLALVALVAGMTAATAASAAFTVPPLVDGHVVDTSGKLSPDDVAALNRQMEATRLQSGYVIDALVVGSLEGGSIDDVAYQTFQTWKPGDAQRDNGVLIVVAPSERQDRIEVGKGVEGALTDLQTDDIRRQFIEPRLKEGDLRGGVGAGADAIAKVLTGADPGHGAQPQGTPIGARTILFGGFFLLIIIFVLVFILFFFLIVVFVVLELVVIVRVFVFLVFVLIFIFVVFVIKLVFVVVQRFFGETERLEGSELRSSIRRVVKGGDEIQTGGEEGCVEVEGWGLGCHENLSW